MVNRLIGYLGELCSSDYTYAYAACVSSQTTCLATGCQGFAPPSCTPCIMQTLQLPCHAHRYLHASVHGGSPYRVPALASAQAGYDDQRSADHGQEAVSCCPLGRSIQVGSLNASSKTPLCMMCLACACTSLAALSLPLQNVCSKMLVKTHVWVLASSFHHIEWLHDIV